MAHKVEVKLRWYQRELVWLLLVALTGIFIAFIAIIVPSVEREQAEQARRVAASQTVPEVTLSCGGDKEYLRLPAVTKIVIIVEPTGASCWTPWLRRPENARTVTQDPDSDIESETAFGEGRIVQRHDNPLVSRWDPQLMNAVRYQNLSNKPVRVPITISY